MAVFLYQFRYMKKSILLGTLTTAAAIFLISCSSYGTSLNYNTQSNNIPKVKQIIYLSPEVYPNLDEIKSPSYQAFFSSISNKISKYPKLKMLRVDSKMSYDSINTDNLREICENNNSEIVIVPKIKYFKIGLGSYVFSNQVVVSMKMYDASGNFIMESTFDTFKKSKRLLGSTENSVKIGTEGAMDLILKEIRAHNQRKGSTAALSTSEFEPNS